MNKVVLKWIPLSAIAALLLALSPSQAETPRSKAQKQARAAVAQKTSSAPAQRTKPAPAQTTKPASAAVARRAPPAGATYASADPGCTTGRKRLWTEAGWMVRRVTSCR